VIPSEAHFAKLDLLRLAIALCEGIHHAPPSVKPKPIQLLVAPGFPQVLVQDPATIAFMAAMRLAAIQQRVQCKPVEGQGLVLFLNLTKGEIAVSAPVARANLHPVGMDTKSVAPINLSLRAVLTGLSRTLAHLQKAG